MASATANRNKLICLVLIILLFAAATASILTGKFPLTIRGLIEGNVLQRKVFFTLRLSRTLTAIICGAVLGICGFVYQTVFRNPLASPDIIGVSSGASFGAAAGILYFGTTTAITASSFCGAILAVCITLLLSSVDRNGRRSTIVLAGIAVHALAQTALMYLKITADPEKQLASIEYWIMGSLSDVSSTKVTGNLILCVVISAVLFLLHRQTILLSADEGEAKMLGADVKKIRLVVLVTATLAVSSAVSITGLISFVGLLAPHGARLLTKNNRMTTMLFSGFLGSIILCAADTIAKTASQTEMPVSIFTSLLGAPMLIILTLKGREEH